MATHKKGILQKNTASLLSENKEVFFSMPFTTLDNKKFRELFNYASVGIVITNSKGEIQMANRYIEQQFGYAEQELLGQKVEILIPSRFKDKHVRHRESFSNDPHSRPMGLGMELSAVKKNGAEFPVEVSLGHYNVDGEGYALAFINDITQRKETEQAIIQLNAHLEAKVKEGSQSLALTVEQLTVQIKKTERKETELERVNTFLNNIWNHAGAIIIVYDKYGLIQFFNPAAEKALGYAADEIVNKVYIHKLHLHEELNEAAARLSEECGEIINPGFDVFKKMIALGKGNAQEWHYVKKGGKSFFVSLDITPLKDGQNNISSYLSIAIDISEKKQAEAELRAALEKEKELNELKSRFVSMASHEFRTPLSAVLSSAYLLSKYTLSEEQPQREKHIKRIVSSVSSLTEILNDFLSVGKIEEGNIYPKQVEYNIKAQIGEVISDIHHLLHKGQEVVYAHTGAVDIYSDPSMMKHIITNLLSNAIKFSPEGGPIHMITSCNEGKFRLSVKDTGLGIPKDDQANLFKRFYRSSNVTNIQGTGLGLHIVKKYVEILSGTIDCISEVGIGTEFIISFGIK